jgi:hypothetical protein
MRNLLLAILIFAATATPGYERAIAASASGTVTVDCLIQTPSVGMVAVERKVKMR